MTVVNTELLSSLGNIFDSVSLHYYYKLKIIETLIIIRYPNKSFDS